MRIAGYEIVETLYESRNSRIYRGRRAADALPVILKTLRDDYPDPAERARLRHEYALLDELAGSGAPRVYELLDSPAGLALVAEDVGARSLAALRDAGPLPLRPLLQLAVAAADALGAVHGRRVIHKHLQPANIVVALPSAPDDLPVLRLIDFGGATRLSRETPALKHPELIEGHLAYISPEQTGRMNRSLDYRTDLYSLGVTLYELLTGRLPFDAADPVELVHGHIARRPAAPQALREAGLGTAPPDAAAAPRAFEVLAAITMRLLAKNAEERYQTALGLEHDLRRALALYDAEARAEAPAAEPFTLGEHDVVGRLAIPQKLYGRGPVLATLLTAFERVVTTGTAELLLVAGAPGTGKSSLVRELHRPMTTQRGRFVAGKFDQLQRNIPYYAWTQALNELCRQLAVEPAPVLAQWRAQLLEAVGHNGALVASIVPDLELVIGPQPAAEALGPQEAQNRFSLAFGKFIEALSWSAQPIILFLDDLQWGDPASLLLLTQTLRNPAGRHLLVIGAYRDGEVDRAHPLALTLAELGQIGVATTTLRLDDLGPDDIHHLVADSLHCSWPASAELAALVHAKTAGNAFFARQFLEALVDDALLRFDGAQGRWVWDLAQLRSRASTDNVVELLIDRLHRLPAETARALQLAACVGARFDAHTLAIVSEQTEPDVQRALWPALEEHYLIPLGEVSVVGEPTAAGERFRFAHDRVQQAAYALIAPAERAAVHLRVGQRMLQGAAAADLDQHIFEVVQHLNAGLGLVADVGERLRLAELNLMAGRKARASAAYGPAFEYFRLGLELLPADAWQRAYELSLALYTAAATAATLSDNAAATFALVTTALEHARDVLDQVPLYEARLHAFNAQRQVREAVATALDALDLLGLTFPAEPEPADFARSLARTQQSLAAHPPVAVAEWPPLRDPNRQATMRVIAAVADAAYHVAPGLLPLLVFEQIRLTAEHGIAPAAAVGFALYGTILCGALDDIATGNRFGQLALDVLERFGADEYRATTMLIVYNNIRPWQAHLETCLAPLLTAYRSGVETGDVTFAAVAAHAYCYQSFFVGRPLDELTAEQATYDAAIARLGQQGFLNYHRMYRQATMNLVGATADPLRLGGPIYDDRAMQPINQAAHDITALFVVHFTQCMLAYLFGAAAEAVAEAELAEGYAAGALGLPHLPILSFYASLARLSVAAEQPPEARAPLLAHVAADLGRLRHWAEYAPINHAGRVALVEAEQARVAGDHWAAAQLYEQAIATARANRYPQEEALAYEVAARFYAAAGMDRIARTYLGDARQRYRRWGASAKLADLARRYAHWPEQTPADPGGAAGSPAARLSLALDLGTVMKALAIIGGELVLERLLERVMQVIMENAGAERGLLLLRAAAAEPQPAGAADDTWVAQVEATVGADAVTLLQSVPLHQAEAVPRSVVDYVARTQAPVVLDDAVAEGLFRQDRYVVRRQSRAIVCVPLLNQGRLIGIVYLENNLTAGAFTPERLDVLELLAAQLAISLDNALLYRALERHRDHLEELVAERTDRLRSALADTARLYEEAQAAKALAEAASRAKSDFLANMSHELRTPLNAVLGFSQLMRSDTGLSAAQAENIRVINRSGEHLLKLINDVLEMSKIEAGRMTLVESDFDLQLLLDDLLMMFRLRADEKGLLLTVTRALDVPRFLHADEGKLRQILINVLGNAVKFTERGSVSLKVARVASAEDQPRAPVQLRFEVADTGPGVRADEAAQLFEPFAQAEAGYRAQQGTGLGLALSRRLARLLGGEIAHQPGGAPGATFVLAVPALAAEALAEPRPARRIVGLAPGQPAYRLLVVDDSPTERLLLRRLLEPLGFGVAEAADGRAAVEQWHSWRPHLIWMDLRMPVLDGYAATREIRAAARGRAPRIIALAAGAFAEEQAQILDAGCDDIVRKPYAQATIFELLERHLGARFVSLEGGDEPVSRAAPQSRAGLAAALARQPAEWVATLRAATVGCDLGQIQALLAELGARDPELAGALREWAENFEYEAILGTLDAAAALPAPTA